MAFFNVCEMAGCPATSLKVVGRYFRASDGAVAEALVRQLDRLQKTRFESEVTTFPVERFQGFLIAALVVMVASEVIPNRTRKSQVTHGRLTGTF